MPEEREIRSAAFTEESLATATFMKGRGCSNCRQTGYRGRKGIFEMLRMTATIRELTFAQAPTQELRRKARATGMRTLLEDGLIKTLKGITTLDEVLSTCHAEVLTVDA